MTRTHARRPKAGFLGRHSLSIATAAILVIWIALYTQSNPSSHGGSFFGNAIADWSGVLVAVIATKYFYEIGSAESRQPKRVRNRFHWLLREHSLSVFLVITGVGWTLFYLHVNPEGKWGQVVGNIVSEWTQQLGMVLLTKKLIEDKSKESKSPARPARSTTEPGAEPREFDELV
jgi:hypothetical protein